MADRREFIKLDVGYLSNPKIAGLLIARRPLAVLVHVECMTYSRQHRTDGIVPAALALRGVIGATKKDLTAAIDAGLLIDRGDGTVEVHDYLEHQESAAEIKARSDAGRAGARARWGRTATTNADRTTNSNANRIPDGNAEERRGEEKDSPNGESGAANAATTPSTTRTRTRGTRLPEPFQVTPDMVSWARENTPGLDHKAVTAAFCDYWRAQPGQKGVKVDWPATWRNWMRRELEHHGGRPATDTPRPGASVWERRVTSGGAQ